MHKLLVNLSVENLPELRKLSIPDQPKEELPFGTELCIKRFRNTILRLMDQLTVKLFKDWIHGYFEKVWVPFLLKLVCLRELVISHHVVD